ncbi:hypothetical protein AaE_012617, partial [Aphanomyces astaci]
MPHGEPLQLTFDAFALGRATRPKRVKPPGGHRVLSRAQESLAALGMIMELAKHDLLLSPNQQQVFGSRVLEPHSQRVYKKHYRGLWYFFGLIGDYTSLLILRHDCPQHAPAMSVKSLCAYLKYSEVGKNSQLMTILPQRVQRRYTIEARLQLFIAFGSSGLNPTDFCYSEGIPRSTWQTWWKKRHLYLNATRNKKRPTLGGQGRPSSILFGSELLAFMQAVRHESHFLTTAHLVTWIKKHQHEWLQGYMSTKTSDIHAYHALIGLRVLEPHSQRVYKKHYRGLCYFFGLIWDYTHVGEEHVCYLKYKTGAIGTILHYDDGLPVLDVDGQPVLCDGQWKDPQNMIQLSSAVSAAHKAKGMGQVPYEEQCDACYRLFSDKSLVTGCRHHAGRGRLSRTGNARFSEDFINCMTRIRKHDLWLYTPSPESMCNPLELVNIRRYLLAANDLLGWKLWTMMIFHIRLFLRSDEGVDFMCSQFLPPLTSVDEFGTVTMLAVQISGKTDKKKWIVLSLYRDDQCPELCPVRAVLAWIHLSRHPGTGYLFPHDKDATKCYPPATFQTKCRNVCTKVTGRQGPFATHWLRKTGWLLATWGGASDVDMQQASRHKSLEMAGRYKQDAQSLLEIAKNQRDKSILQYVPKWRAVFVSNLQAAAGVNVDSSTEPMPVLACKFIKDIINAGLLNKADTDSPMHVANACMKNVQGWDLKSEINDIQRQLEVKACGCATEVRRLVQLLSKYHTGPATPCVIEGYAVPTSPTLVPTDLDSDATELITSVLPPELSSEAFVPPSSSLHAVPPLPLLPFVLMSSSLRT